MKKRKLSVVIGVLFMMALGSVLCFWKGQETRAAQESTEAWMYFASGDWGAQCWGKDNIQNAKVTHAVVTGEGQYTLSIDFTESINGYANGIGVVSVCVMNGEILFPEYTIALDKVVINGENVNVAKGYTYADSTYTRLDLHNEVSDINVQKGVRSADGSLKGVSATIIPYGYLPRKVTTLEITFTYAPKVEVKVPVVSDSLSEEVKNDLNKMSCTVKNVTVQADGRKKAAVKITWSKKADAYGYQIYRSQKKNGKYKMVGSGAAGTSTYTDKNIEKGKTYYYTVRALGGSVANSYEGKFSKAKKVQVSSALAKPVLKCSKSGKKITLDFSGAEGDKYQLEYRYSAKNSWKSKSGTIKSKVTVTLSSKAKVQVRIRTSMKVNGKTTNSKWSSAKWVK